MLALNSLVGSIIAPGFVAAVVAFILNTRDERHRTLRDYKTKFSDDTREDIRLAVAAGVAYFSCKDAAKLRELEAQVLLYESDVRSGLAAIRGECAGKTPENVLELKALEADFLDALTGGPFGSATLVPDLNHTRKLVGRASLLRSALAELRRRQLGRTTFPYQLNRAIGLLILLVVIVGIAFGVGLYAGATIAR
jgi:hypothetical protein